MHCGPGPADVLALALKEGRKQTMTTFTASERLEVEVVTEMERPHLVIRDTLEAGGGDPLFVIVYPNEVKALLTALADATVSLVDGVGEP